MKFSRAATTACRWVGPLLRRPGHAVVALALLWLAGWTSMLVLFPAAGVALMLTLWFRLDRRSFSLWVQRPLLVPLWRHRVRAHWAEVARACNLELEGRTPELRRLSTDWPRIFVVARPAPGHTYEHFEQAAEALRLAYGASQVRVEPHGVRDVVLVLTVGDVLAVPFHAQVPASGSLDMAVMGRRSDGATWRLPIGPHTLVAGSSGSGKGSVFWSFAFALAPAVRDGQVQLHGIDLKGGMEILMGEELFTSKATTAAEAVAVLEDLVGRMRRRTVAYAGRLRSHAASVEEPLHVVMIDELAALTAYCSDRDLQRRAERAINILCSQGRAPGFMVFACLQDPRKEVIPSRGLFTQMVGLRLKDLSETSMVLGELAVQTGAHCHRISRLAPGTGYVVPEDGGSPIRVRAGYASDEAIRGVSRRYASPTQLPVIVPPAGSEGIDSRRVRAAAL